MITDLDEKNFKEYISKGLQVVMFSAKWCTYCQKQYEVLRELNDIKIGRVDGDASPSLVGQFGIMGFPTFIIFKNGEVLTKFSGYKNKFELMNVLSQYL